MSAVTVPSTPHSVPNPTSDLGCAVVLLALPTAHHPSVSVEQCMQCSAVLLFLHLPPYAQCILPSRESHDCHPDLYNASSPSSSLTLLPPSVQYHCVQWGVTVSE